MTHDSPVSRILPPTTLESNTHILWTERRCTTARSAGSCHRRSNQTLTLCGQNDDARQPGQQDLATDARIKHSHAVDRTTTHDSPVSRILPPTLESNTHSLWTERRRTTARSAGSCHRRSNQTLTRCGQNDDARQPGQQDLATDARIKHSRSVDRTTTHDSPVSRILPPTTLESNTHDLWTERRRTTARSADLATDNARIKHSHS